MCYSDKTTKCAHEFRATPLECNAGQCGLKLIMTLFHKRYMVHFYISLVCVTGGADSIGHGGHVPPLLQIAGHGGASRVEVQQTRI